MAVYSAGTSNRYITLTLHTAVAGQDIAGNTTTLSWYLSVEKSSSSTSATWGSCSYSVNINGTVYNGSGRVDVSPGGSTTLLSGSTTVPHSSDGTKIVGLSASISGKISGSINTSESLSRIPRASTMTVSGATLGSPMTFRISSASGAFTHSLTYEFGGARGTILSYKSAGSYEWTPPMSFAGQIPNAVSGVVQFVLYTWAGEGASIGVTNYTATLSVPESVTPSISGIQTADMQSGVVERFGAFVQQKSAIHAEVAAEGIYGSTIRSCSISFDGRSYNGVNADLAAPTVSGALPLTATVTDTRGRTSSKTIQLTVLPYSNPAILALSAYRCDQNGKAMDDGDYAAITYAYAVSDVGGKNTAAAVISSRRSSGGSAEEIWKDTSFSANKTVFPKQQLISDYQFSLTLTVTDYFGQTEMTVMLPSAAVILDLLASGKGVSFGRAAERENALETAWPLYIGGVQIPYVIEASQEGAEGLHYRAWSDGTMECWGVVPALKARENPFVAYAEIALPNQMVSAEMALGTLNDPLGNVSGVLANNVKVEISNPLRVWVHSYSGSLKDGVKYPVSVYMRGRWSE